jgi:DNA-binding MarR family transcriptional regulator/GNAT superfamily N-acetyltransferase
MSRLTTGADTRPRIDAVRRFNRFYTQKIGALNERLLRTRFSLAEARVLYELSHREGLTASSLGRDLGLDAGYLSRILGGFEQDGLLKKTRSKDDGRQSHLFLTPPGKEAFLPLDQGAQEEVSRWLEDLPPSDQVRLTKAMALIEDLLSPRRGQSVPHVLRPHRPGDMGWVVERHGALYAQEYGWDERFEGLVAEIVAKFLESHDPKRERCWIAEREGERVGSVFLVRKTRSVARLRLLLVESSARGQGIGSRLVGECTAFARAVGYRKITLWTNSVLLAARGLYERAGFRLVRSEPHERFGHTLVGETWELEL